MARKKQKHHIGELTGPLLFLAGILLFLSLVSYEPSDLPTWVPFSKSNPVNDPVMNFVGPVGAITGGILYFLIGGASYLLAVVLIGWGCAKWLAINLRIRAKLLWLAVFLASGACLLSMQTSYFQDWGERFNIQTAGGWLGYILGTRFLLATFGSIGSIVFVSCAYVTSLILITGIRPVELIRTTREAFKAWMAEREKRRLEEADLEERIRLDQARLDKERKKLERQLKKDGALPQAVSRSDNPDEAPENFPPPEIIDGTAHVPTKREDPEKPEINTRPEISYENYQLPDFDLLAAIDMDGRDVIDKEELLRNQSLLVETLEQFGIAVTPGNITRGPTITRYEVYPAKGVRVDKIVSLERDIARATRAERINILAPIPGKDTVGIELANSKKVTVTLREILESDDWALSTARIPLALGKDVYGKTIIADLAQMPHCLVAGTTGSGKSVCINSMVASMLYKFSPEDLRLVMIDPKVVELQMYNKLPHLVVPVVNDPKKVLLALRWVIEEMENRYRLFAKSGVRNIVGFNAHMAKLRDARKQAEALATVGTDGAPIAEDDPMDGDIEGMDAGGDEVDLDAFAKPRPGISVPRDEDIMPEHLPYIVVIIDELADLMQTAPADVESAIARITQMARAAGIHMIVATQTPRADVITGVIKANIPSRIAFQVASKLDSRVILDENGADRLLGQGDMLYLPPGTSRLVRTQGVFVTDGEITSIVDFVAAQVPASYDESVNERLESPSVNEEDVSEEDEELIVKSLEILRQEKIASTSRLQRRLRIGYTRAARVVDIMEQRGILGPGDGAKPREILVDLDNYPH